MTMLTVERPSGPLECAFVAIGAMLVGSIFHSVEEGATVRRGDELSGYQYGGSTSILLSALYYFRLLLIFVGSSLTLHPSSSE